MPRSRKFCQRGSNFDKFFFTLLVYERWADPNTTISRSSSARQWNTIWMVFRWWADDGPTLNAGSVALWFFRGSWHLLLHLPYSFVIFFRVGGGGGGVRTPCPPPPICACDLSMNDITSLYMLWWIQTTNLTNQDRHSFQKRASV